MYMLKSIHMSAHGVYGSPNLQPSMLLAAEITAPVYA
jgi:hypothetical protein